MRYLLRITLNILLLACVFDPADKIFHLKVPTFISLFALFVIDSLIHHKAILINKRMLYYVGIFSVLLPLISLVNYAISSSDYIDYSGFIYFKAYLFLAIGFIIYRYDIDMFKTMSYILSLLSISILVVFVLIVIGAVDSLKLYKFGLESGMFAFSERSYGGLEYKAIYFHTAPLLVIPLGYFYYKSRFIDSKIGYSTFILIPIFISMLLAGTRNSIIFAVLIPILIEICFGNNKKLIIATLMVVCFMAFMKFNGIFLAMIDLNETSNFIKMSYLKDYSEIFASPKNLLFGQGMGASFYSAVLDQFVSVVELTYIELVRVHGLFVAVIYFVMLTLPFIKYKQYGNNKYILIVYFAYLAMSATNPFIFSSTGMIVLASVITPMFLIADASTGTSSNPSALAKFNSI